MKDPSPRPAANYLTPWGPPKYIFLIEVVPLPTSLHLYRTSTMTSFTSTVWIFFSFFFIVYPKLRHSNVSGKYFMLLLLWNLTEGFPVLFPRNTFRISFSFMNLGFWGFEKYSSFGGNSFVFSPHGCALRCAWCGVGKYTAAWNWVLPEDWSGNSFPLLMDWLLMAITSN